MLSYTTIIDISRPIHEGMMLAPGDPAVRFVKNVQPQWVDTVISMNVHTGTHVDAPLDVFPDARSIDRVKLDRLIGPCRVLDMMHVVECIEIMDLETLDIKKGERLVFKTRNSVRGYKEFFADHVYMSIEAAGYLVDTGVLLVGFDYLSIDKGDEILTHKVLLGSEVALVENLNLAKVDPGSYGLVILPLRLVDLDGAPARAVLLKD